MTASLSSLRGFFVHGNAESEYDCSGARYCDARIGRWLNVDPLGDKALHGARITMSMLTHCDSMTLRAWRGRNQAAAFIAEVIFEAQMIEQEAFQLLKDRGMLVGGTPRLDDQGRLVSIDDAEGTDVMYTNPKWLAKENISAGEGNKLIVKAIEGVWLRKNRALYLRPIKGQTDADRIRLRRLAGRIDASAAAPADHTYTSPD